MHLAAVPTDDSGLLPVALPQSPPNEHRRDSQLYLISKVREWRQSQPLENIRDAALSLEALWKQRESRLQVLRALSNPWPTNRYVQATPVLRLLPPGNLMGTEMPHAVFRERLQAAGIDSVRRAILSAQLLHCDCPAAVLRVIAVAMQNKITAMALASMHEPLMRAMYRCRANATDREVLRTLNTIITRFGYAGIPVVPALLQLALKFAARARDLTMMYRCLRRYKDAGLGMTSHVFRSVIAKCSIGHRGLGEIRNGRWRRRDLLQVMLGFENERHLAPEQRCHLGMWLDRTEWQFLHGWICVLARCREADAVWNEWLFWQRTTTFRKPKQLAVLSKHAEMTTKTRGEFFFVEQMLFAKDSKRAWQTIRELEIPFAKLKVHVQDELLNNIEYARIWNEDIKDAVLQKYDRDLKVIEKALGVQWIQSASSDEADGHHKLIQDQEAVLDQLGADHWRLEPDHGFPWDDESS